jgi:glycine/D-amino acid oxidase-like deaminating enzyme
MKDGLSRSWRAGCAFFDCIVVGGGPAGCAAAAAAAAGGASTLLVERHGFLGGMGTAAGLSAFINYRYRSTDLSQAFYRSVVSDLAAHGATYRAEGGNVDVFEPEALKCVLESRLTSAGVELALHAAILRIDREGGEWVIQVFQKGGVVTWRARYVIDATGDADVATRAGAGVTHGRRSDGKTQPLTMIVQLGGVSPEEFGRRVRALVDERFIFHSDCLAAEIATARGRGEWTIPRENVAMFWSMPWDPTRVTINGTRILGLNAARGEELSAAEGLGRRQAWELAAFFRKYIPGFGRATLLQTGPQVGVRETRRIVGLGTLSEADVLSSRQPEDSVVFCSYPIDVHQPDGTGSDFNLSDDYCYGIPLRCLLPAGVPDLIAAGRCISATHEAAGSFRVMSTCMNLGEAAGTAVVVALNRNVELAAVDAGEVRARLQEALGQTPHPAQGAAVP